MFGAKIPWNRVRLTLGLGTRAASLAIKSVLNKPINNIADIELQPRAAAFAPTGDAAKRFDASIGQIAPLIGARRLGYNITVMPPGKRALPFHNHRVNEEMSFILEGTGELRFSESTRPVCPGDVIACPAGGRDRALQILKAGDREMRYLAVSTQYEQLAGKLRA
jgi:uncharacterized cupin superfamily protein